MTTARNTTANQYLYRMNIVLIHTTYTLVQHSLNSATISISKTEGLNLKSSVDLVEDSKSCQCLSK